MNLKIYNHEQPRKSKVQTVGVNRYGRFTFSQAAVTLFALKDGMRISFAKDNDSRNDWYVAFDTDKGSVLRFTVRKRADRENPTRATITTNRRAANAILDSISVEKGATFLISQKPVIVFGIKWHRLITAKPIVIK